MKVNKYIFVTITFALAGWLVACESEAVVPDPIALTREANGHYCGMIVVDHPGPKAQVHEKGRDKPRWFSSVRDAMAYLRLPGEARGVTAVYVHDMGRAPDWKKPQNDGIWIDAKQAVYVLGSSRRGGMGAKETVPFAERAAAEKFAQKFGGKVANFAEIADDYVLGDKNEQSGAKKSEPDTHADHKHHAGH